MESYTKDQIEKVLRATWNHVADAHEENPKVFHEDYLDAVDETLESIRAGLGYPEYKQSK